MKTLLVFSIERDSLAYMQAVKERVIRYLGEVNFELDDNICNLLAYKGKISNEVKNNVIDIMSDYDGIYLTFFECEGKAVFVDDYTLKLESK